MLLSVVLRAGAWPSPVVLEMQALGAGDGSASLREDLGSVPSTRFAQLTTAKSNFQGSDALLYSCAHVLNLREHVHVNKIENL